ncbi:MAG: ankyrin repeat domain-containing protein [Myxococcota bacterium]
MSGSSAIRRLFGLAAIVLGGVGVWVAVSFFYSWSENRAFAALRERSELNCAQTPLHCAVRDGDAGAISAFLDGGGDLELRDGWGRTALAWAAAHDSVAHMGRLLHAGAQPDAPNDAGRTAFAEAATRDKFEIADVLLEGGADVDAMNGVEDRSTALHLCVMANRVACVRYLLERGPRPDVEDSYGYTAVERAQTLPDVDPEIVALLVGGMTLHTRQSAPG